MKLDEQMMNRCLELANLAAESGEAAVGSIVVRNDEIIAEGIESVKLDNDPTAHAEIEAVRLACKKLHTLDLSECALYTNVEPCWMCSYAIRQTRIGRVVFGSRNTRIGGFSSKFQILADENLRMPVPNIDAF